MMLYYADWACNVPIYLHINLSQDNEHLLALLVVCLDLPAPGHRRHAQGP